MYLKLVCLLAFTLGVYSSELLSDGISPFFVYLGESNDGKKYYADISVTGNWNAVKTYCTSLGMKLASIETPEQAEFLNRVSGATEFNGGFWTVGRDALELRQFSWDGTDTQPLSHPGDGASLQPSATGPVSCLEYNADPKTSGLKRYRSRLCGAMAAALCEA